MPVVVSTTLAVLSQLPVARYRPSGLKATATTLFLVRDAQDQGNNGQGLPQGTVAFDGSDAPHRFDGEQGATLEMMPTRLEGEVRLGRQLLRLAQRLGVFRRLPTVGGVDRGQDRAGREHPERDGEHDPAPSALLPALAALVQKTHGLIEAGVVALGPRGVGALSVFPIQGELQGGIAPQRLLALCVELGGPGQAPIALGAQGLLVRPLAQPVPETDEALVRDVDYRLGGQLATAGRRQEGPAFGSESVDDRDDRLLIGLGHGADLPEPRRAPVFLLFRALLGQALEELAGDPLAGGPLAELAVGLFGV